MKPRMLAVSLLVGTPLVHLLPANQPPAEGLARADFVFAASLSRALSDAP